MNYRNALVLPIAMALSAHAVADDNIDISELKKLLMQQSAELAELKNRLADLEQKNISAVAVSGDKRVVVASAPVATSTPVPVEAKKNKFTATPKGRIQYDTVFYDEKGGARDYRDGSGFRRARLGLKGKMPGNFEYQIKADFAGGDSVKLDDTFIRYRFNPTTTVTMGFHKVYHSIESATSDVNVTFMERHMVSNAFEKGAGGKMGVSIMKSGSNWSGQFGVMAGSPNSGSGGEDGWGVNGRVTWAPILSDERVLHLGLAAYYRDEDDNALKLSDRPELRRDSFKPFTTDSIVAESYSLGNAEIAAVVGPVSAQFEYSVMETSSSTGDYSYDGYSGQVSYFLTGESKPYSAGKGSFGKLKPHNPVGSGGFGAIEIAARYSKLDLLDGGLGTSGDNYTIGLNWYPTSYVRFMLNAVDFTAKGVATVEKGRAYGLRVQTVW